MNRLLVSGSLKGMPLDGDANESRPGMGDRALSFFDGCGC